MEIVKKDVFEKMGLTNLWANQNGKSNINVGQQERQIAIVGGGLLALYGLTRFSLNGLALAGIGAGLVYQGVTGHSPVYEVMGRNTAEVNRNPNAAVQASRAIKVKRSITINKSREELYRFWRNFENLPQFMDHLEKVSISSDSRSHWVAKAPAGQTVEWDSEIINEKENELIAWKSLAGSQVPNAGSVEFKEAPGGRGTEVKVEIDYEPPAGQIGALIAKLFGEEPAVQVQEDLRHLKQIMETGEKPTTKGQSTCR